MAQVSLRPHNLFQVYRSILSFIIMQFQLSGTCCTLNFPFHLMLLLIDNLQNLMNFQAVRFRTFAPHQNTLAEHQGYRFLRTNNDPVVRIQNHCVVDQSFLPKLNKENNRRQFGPFLEGLYRIPATDCQLKLAVA